MGGIPYDGGQAFPRTGYDGPDSGDSAEDGMSLRDWFAGQALAGLCSCDTSQFGDDMTGDDGNISVSAVAAYAYAHADAMLKARGERS